MRIAIFDYKVIPTNPIGSCHRRLIQGLCHEHEFTVFAVEFDNPFTRGKIHVISNPVDLERMTTPPDFDREAFRRERGCSPEDVVLVFVALGHFERKGLPLILEALKELGDARIKLWVVGGEADLVRSWASRVREMGLEKQVSFFGMQQDVRLFLWGAEAFVFPSSYETFSLVSFEAAAAGLPLIVTPLYGVEEFMRDGETGFVVPRDSDKLQEAIAKLATLEVEKRVTMGKMAREAVRGYGIKSFVENWRRFYGF